MSALPEQRARGIKGIVTRARWNPYAVGALLGVLSWAVFAIVNAPLGVTTAVGQWSGAVVEPVVGTQGLQNNAYWSASMPAWNYGTLFLVGTFLGALVSALISNSFKIETVPLVWQQRYGPAPLPRLIVAFIGGIVAMYGARMAGGCTSGNGLSGSMQLAVSGWTFFFTMFASGLIAAFLIFRKPVAKA